MSAVICPNCQHANRQGARFCDNCGLKLEILCTDCGTVNRPGARFCDNCGNKLTPDTVPPHPGQTLSSAERIAVPGERRIVTILFCDIVGSTSAAEGLDPEEWTEILKGALQHMISPVHAYGGTVARLLGDAILAFFGAPIAHEDDAERAILAGLEISQNIASYAQTIRAKWNLNVNVRIGINTGLVVVGEIGADQRMEYTAIGDAINIAARMEQLALPGTVQIAHDTYKLVAPLFEVADLGPIPVKGKSEPIQTYRVLGRRTEADRQRDILGLQAPLVGRDQELSILNQQLGQLEDGVGGIVCLAGDAGLGKSRLLTETRAQFSQHDRWIDIASVSYETNVPYSLIRRLFACLWGTTPGDELGVQLARLQDFVANMPPAEQQLIVETVSTLWGKATDLMGETFRGQLFMVSTMLLEHWVDQDPVVLACDDIHWTDITSAELLMHLFTLTESIPLLILCSFRPDRDGAGWQLRTRAEEQFPHRTKVIWLHPLAINDCNTLVNTLLHVGTIPEKLRQSILERSAGNPFFLEEVVRSLISHGIVRRDVEENTWHYVSDRETFEIPDNVQSLLIARVDRLQEEPKRTLQLAAVIGRSFYQRVLMGITEAAGTLDRQLRILQREELIIETARLPEIEFMFRHSLMQEAAYSTILLRVRRDYHRLVADTFVSLYPDRQDELAASIAHHYVEAQLPERALAYFIMAGDAAFRLHAVPVAGKHYSAALEIALDLDGSNPDQLRYLFLRKGRSLELNSQFGDALEVYQEMARYGEERHQPALLLAAINAKGTLYATANPLFDQALGLKAVEEALALAQSLHDRKAEVQALWNLTNIHRFGVHSINDAITCGEKALQLARELGMEQQLPFILNDLADVYATGGQIELAKIYLQEASALWRQRQNLPMLADTLTTAASVELFSNQFVAALHVLEESLVISRRIGNIWGQAYALILVGYAHALQGRIDEGFVILEEGIALSDQVGFLIGQCFPRALLAWIYLRLGAPQIALKPAQEAAHIAEEHIPQILSVGRGMQALTCLELGDLDNATTYMAEAERWLDPDNRYGIQFIVPALVTLAIQKGDGMRLLPLVEQMVSETRQSGTHSILAYLLIARAEILIAYNRSDEAVTDLTTALAIIMESRQRLAIWYAAALLAPLLAKQGALAEAERVRDHGREAVRYIANRISDPDLQANFLNQRMVKSLM